MVDKLYLLLFNDSFITKNSSNEPVNDVIPDNLKTRLMSHIYFFTVLGLVIVDVKISIIISRVNSLGISGAGSGIVVFQISRFFYGIYRTDSPFFTIGQKVVSSTVAHCGIFFLPNGVFWKMKIRKKNCNIF